MSKKLFMLLFACGLLFAAGQGQAAGFYGPGADNYNAPQANPGQADAAREIIDSNYAKLGGTLEALAAKRDELDALLASPNPDGARIESLSREIGELRGKVLAARAQIRSQLAQKGLSPNFLGSNRADPDDNYGPRGYHHNRRHHGGMGYRGCPAGCWGYMGDR